MIKKIILIATYCLILMLLITLFPYSCKKKNRSPTPTKPIGSSSTYTRKPESYQVKATDPDKDNVRIIWDWDDGHQDTSDFVVSGEDVFAKHTWVNASTYNLKIKAIDDKGAESDWSEPLKVTVIYNAPPLIDSITGPGISPYYSLPNRLLKFTTIARDPTDDNVYVRFLHKRINETQYTTRDWIGPKVSGSIFRDSISFAQNDTYMICAIAKDSKGSESDTSRPIYKVVISGPLWTFQTDDEYDFTSSPALAQHTDGSWRLFIGGTDGYFYILRASDGTRLARIASVSKLEGDDNIVFNASPAVNQGLYNIYCGSEEGELYCISTGGARKWRYPNKRYEDLTGDEFGTSAAISVTGNNLYVACDNDTFYAFRDNGTSVTKLWTYYTGISVNSSPAIDASGNIYFGDDSGYVRCLNQNGTQLWRKKVGSGVATSPALTADRVYVGTDDNYLYALKINDGTPAWYYLAGDMIRSSPVIGADGTIYFGCNDGKLYALTSAGTPKPGFPIQLSEDELTSTPAIASDGTIVVYVVEDIVYGISPAGAIVWRVLLPGYGKNIHKKSKFESFYPSPTIGPDGTVYVASANAGVFAVRKITGNALANTPWPKFRHDIRNTGNSNISR